MALGYEDAFKRYKAKLNNVQWSVCAETPYGELVISCWQHHIKSKDGIMTYYDKLSRWSGAGNRELTRKLSEAFNKQQSIKLIVAVAEGKEEQQKVDNGNDGSKIKKHFFIKPEVLGKITKFDGDNFVIRFEPETQNSE